MELYFTCPKEKRTFRTDDYSLKKGHYIVEDDEGNRELIGLVSLNSGCPLCNELHSYEIKDVICPLEGSKSEKQFT